MKNYLRDSSLTEKRNGWCPASLIQAGALTASTSLVWKELHNQILEASYKAHPHIETLNSTQLDAYKDWVDQLFSFYTPSKLRRSIMNPAPPKQIVKLLKLAAEIRQHNANLPDEAEDGDGGVKVENKTRTLRILLMGGSVTSGIGCFWPDGINIQKPSHWAKPGEGCAWSFRLEKLLNHVLFDGEKVVIVDNISTGGQTTEFGSYVLDYRLFPKPEDVPAVVIGAFSANEAQEADLQKTFYEYNQNFVKSAQSLHPCDDEAPIIMMVDDYYGGRPFKAIVQTGNTFMLSTWNNIMSVNYGSTIKHKIEADFENEPSKLIPLLHSNYQIHMGAGMHSGLAWTVFFNLVDSIVNVCNDMEIGIENHASHDSSSATSSTTALRTQRTHNQIIDPHLLQDLEKEEPSYKHIGKIQIDDKQGSVQKLHQELEESINSTKIFCDNLEKSANASNNNTQQKVNPQRCSYSWVVNNMAGFGTKQQVNEKMSQVLLRNNGWAAEGYPVRQPRSGWYTHTPESDFSIMIKDSPIVIKYVIILSMKSYSAKWENSKLAVSTTVIKDQAGIRKDEINEQELLIDWSGNIDDKKLFFIDGYQDIKTSVHFPHKISISEEAKVGDSIILNAKLVGGQEFKIAGIAFCSF